MKAAKSDIGQLFAGSTQFTVPVYQRRYAWELPQCKRLWGDIVRVHRDNRPGHFVGSIVNIAEPAQAGVQRYLLIDGQQRMATLTLLMCAVRDMLAAQSGEQAQDVCARVSEGYLLNPQAEKTMRHKLLLGPDDTQLLCALVDGKPILADTHSRLLNAYRFFGDCLRQAELSPAQLLETVQKLQVVNITLEREDDDPQLIFESLNSTGLDLSQSDLIRNYVLMGLPTAEQNEIYHTVWHPMESLFEYARQSALMDRFLRDFLTMKLGRIPKVDRVYDAFKELYPTRQENARALCETLLQHARYYTNLYYCTSEGGKWDEAFRDIKALQMEVSYPFLLRAYADWHTGGLTDSEFAEILRLCESYVLRRAICEIPTNSLNKTFACIKNEIVEKRYLQSVRAYFLTRESYKEFPSNQRFLAGLRQKDVYNMRIRNYILAKLEKAGGRPVNIDNYTVEQILPASPSLGLEWRRSLGSEWKRIQRTWAGTIGNLALVTYSTDRGERTLAEKLDGPGGVHATDTCLNQSVGSPAQWGEQEILQRTDSISQLALKIWQAPVLSKAELTPYMNREKAEQYSATSYDFNAFTKILFEHLDRRVGDFSPAVKRDFKKQHITYYYETCFMDITVQKSRLRLALSLFGDEVRDPGRLCRTATVPNKWTVGDIEVYFESLEQLPAVLELVWQAYHKQTEI